MFYKHHKTYKLLTRVFLNKKASYVEGKIRRRLQNLLDFGASKIRRIFNETFSCL